MLSKSVYKRLTVQKDIDWDKVNGCKNCPVANECGRMEGKCPFTELSGPKKV